MVMLMPKAKRRFVRVWQEVSIDARRLPAGFISVEDAAVWIGVSDETMRRYIREGMFTGVTEEDESWGREGWRYVIDTQALMAFKKVRDTQVGPGGRLPKGYSD